MYIAALRIGDDFGLDAVGIQYQQGLKDTVPASDLAEGLLNNAERPPVLSRDGTRELYAGAPLPHFNEVDEGVAVDALVTNRIWTRDGPRPGDHAARRPLGRASTTASSSGSSRSPARCRPRTTAATTSSYSMRQPPMYFPLGGGTLSGVSKPGRDRLVARVHHGRRAARRPRPRPRRRRCPPRRPSGAGRDRPRSGRSCTRCCTASSRDQLMARHKANHVQVVYAPDADDRRPGAAGQGRDVRRARRERAPLRRRHAPIKALVLHQPGKMSVDEVPDPTPATGEIVVAPRAVGVAAPTAHHRRRVPAGAVPADSGPRVRR